MRLALTVWKGRISPVLDVAQRVLLLDVEDGKVVSRREERLPGVEPVEQATRIAALEVRTLVCGAISCSLAELLAAKGVQTIPFIAGGSEEVVVAFLAGTLSKPSLSMPGCCGTRIRFGSGSAGRCRRGRWRTAGNVDSDQSAVIGNELATKRKTSAEES